MNLKPLPHFFIVKINIEEQKIRKEKVGSLYLHCSEVQMQRNMQCGDIVAMGDIASDNFKEAKIGDTLIFHHFVEGDKDSSNLIASDGIFNYYNVTASEYNGHRNESFGVWDGKNIIPHPDFIFIEPEIKEKALSQDEFIEKNTTKVGSLILFNSWEESREEKEEKARAITSQIKNASKGKSMSDGSRRAIEEMQNEAASITLSLNKKEYKPYKVFAANPSVQAKENVYALNISASMKVEFMGVEYTVIQTKYTAATA